MQSPGKAWATGGVVEVDLPDCEADPSDDNIQEYARLGGVSVEWVEDRLARQTALPRSLCGIPVEVNGKIWGVMVLDSFVENGINYNSHTYNAFKKLVGIVLGEFLKRI